MKIGNVMSRDVQLIKPDDTIRSAAALMKKIDAGLLPVTENDKLVGMITDRDIAIRGVAEGKGPDAKVRDAMSPEVKYCFEDEDVAHVAENMAELQVRRLPVMNRDKRLVGIVSLADLAIEGSLPKTAKALHGISPGSPVSVGHPDEWAQANAAKRDRVSDRIGLLIRVPCWCAQRAWRGDCRRWRCGRRPAWVTGIVIAVASLLQLAVISAKRS